jgi:hypothetical protein
MFLIYLAVVTSVSVSEPFNVPVASDLEASADAPRVEAEQWHIRCREAGSASAERVIQRLPLIQPTVEQMIYCTPDEIFAPAEAALRKLERTKPPRTESVSGMMRKALTGGDGIIQSAPLDTRAANMDLAQTAADEAAEFERQHLGTADKGNRADDPQYPRQQATAQSDQTSAGSFGWIVALITCLSVVGYFTLRGPAKQIKMGRHLSQMTNICEEIERTRHTMNIGAGGGIDSLPPAKQWQAEVIFKQGIAYLGTYPRHEVTRELTKNALLAEQMGRPLRVGAIHRLIQALVYAGIALDIEDFMRSYATRPIVTPTLTPVQPQAAAAAVPAQVTAPVDPIFQRRSDDLKSRIAAMRSAAH